MSFAGKAKALGLVDTGANKIELGDVQLTSVLQFINENSYITTYGTSIPVGEVSQGSVTYNKNVAATLKDKTAIGQGTTEAGAITQETVYMNSGKYFNEGITAADELSGFASAVGVKLEGQMAQLRTYRERQAFVAIAADTGNDEVDLGVASAVLSTEADAEKAYALLVAQANDLHKKVDADQAIDTIDPSMIFIDVDPTLFSGLVRLGFASGSGKEMFTNGRFDIANLGGFTIRSNPYLAGNKTHTAAKDLVGIVSTTFAGAAPMKMVASNAGRFDGSNDKVIYTEAKFGSDNAGVLKAFTPIYTGVTKLVHLS